MDTTRHGNAERISARLGDDTLVWLTTIDDEGRPQPSLVWFLWEGDDVLVYSKPHTQKIANIAARPHVALNFNSSEDGNDMTVIQGTARFVDDVPPPHLNEPYIARYRDTIAQLDSTPEEFIGPYSQAIRITLDSARGF
jgi:PPOX class probable F420-dependent enzyme